MPFDQPLRDAVDFYARADLDGGLAEHVAFFDFLVCDPDLMQRVGEEYYTARYTYKLLEGLRIPEGWARRAQVQLQVQQYASIYEACIHHLLFTHCKDTPQVIALQKIRTLKHWSVNADIQGRLEKAGDVEGRPIVAAVEATIDLSETKIRFDSKSRAAAELGLISHSLSDELINFYAARNLIHIHAELKKGANWNWEIEFARQAYWRLLKFREEVNAWLLARQTSSHS